MSNLTTADKVNCLLGNMPITYSCYGGKKLSINLCYILEVTNTSPYTLTAYFLSTKTVDNKPELIKTAILNIIAGNNTLTFDSIKHFPLGKKAFKVGDIYYNFHSEVITNLAIPYWIDNASKYIKLNNVAPMWLVMSQLILKTETVASTEITQTSKAKPFTIQQFHQALIEASKILPENKELKNAVDQIPEEYQYLRGAASNATVDVLPVEIKPITGKKN